MAPLFSMKQLVAALCVAVNVSAAAPDRGSVAYWSADGLKAGHAERMPLITPTHAFVLTRLTRAAQAVAESHEGTTDVFFVVAGGATMIAGGDIEGGSALPGKPGEIRGRSIKGGQRYELTPGAVINIPPSTPCMTQPGPDGLTAVRLKINVGMHPWSIASTQQTTLPATATHPRVMVPVSADQGSVVYWSADMLRNAHETMSAAPAKGQPMNDPRDLVPIPATRTHAWNFLNRHMGADGQPPGVEFHEGNTDIYFIVAGSGTVMTGGEIVSRELIPSRPGEYRGTSIRNGHGYKVKAGDVINMPPSTPHQSLPDPGGFSYILVKVNVGAYPWSIVDLQK
jgi:mannose-6-phosphate isomerase-like protein (cupin superfamily)